MSDRFGGVRIAVPPSVVLGTDVFDEFLEHNDLRDFALNVSDQEEIERRFIASPLPDAVMRDLAAFLEIIRYPIAVRSSSLLEDSQYQPFAGVYDTLMLANSHPEAKVAAASARQRDQARLRLDVLDAARRSTSRRRRIASRKRRWR